MHSRGENKPYREGLTPKCGAREMRHAAAKFKLKTAIYIARWCPATCWLYPVRTENCSWHHYYLLPREPVHLTIVPLCYTQSYFWRVILENGPLLPPTHSLMHSSSQLVYGNIYTVKVLIKSSNPLHIIYNVQLLWRKLYQMWEVFLACIHFSLENFPKNSTSLDVLHSESRKGAG